MLRVVSWRQHRTNSSILEEVEEQRRLLSIVKCRKLRYFGHVVRAHNLRTSILRGHIDSTRPRGRIDVGQTTSILIFFLIFMHHVTRLLETNSYVRCLLIDFSKALMSLTIAYWLPNLRDLTCLRQFYLGSSLSLLARPSRLNVAVSCPRPNLSTEVLFKVPA